MRTGEVQASNDRAVVAREEDWMKDDPKSKAPEQTSKSEVCKGDEDSEGEDSLVCRMEVRRPSLG